MIEIGIRPEKRIELEQHLMGKGLTQEEANVKIEEMIEGFRKFIEMQQQNQPPVSGVFAALQNRFCANIQEVDESFDKDLVQNLAGGMQDLHDVHLPPATISMLDSLEL